MPRGVSLDGYFVEWDVANRKIKIRPKNPSSNIIAAGLGNAKMVVDLTNVPRKFFTKVTGDPDVDVAKMLAPIDFGVTQLMQSIRNPSTINVRVNTSSGVRRFEAKKGDIQQFKRAPYAATLSGYISKFKSAFGNRILW